MKMTLRLPKLLMNRTLKMLPEFIGEKERAANVELINEFDAKIVVEPIG